MGKHGGKKQRLNPLIIALFLLAVILVVGLGTWWWSLRSSTDPISADPVQAYATVTASQPCTVAGANTAVDMNTSSGIVSANIAVCGFRVDQSVLVEYLRSEPTRARVFGTSTKPPASTTQKLLPIGVLILGVIAAGAALTLLRENKKVAPRIRRAAGAQRAVVMPEAAPVGVAGVSAVSGPVESLDSGAPTELGDLFDSDISRS
ncbi:hypothetical protein EH165_09930 [Nakamurella antarctica]|uniref:Uncharacterized protein n=1 Tax=Nakamurella antarctica TaxID=1902245 RepID=A0A3G8ZMD6_9ACTN|nr:hypothetical protein [Nakamurella antarctica]AZI58410.1 hypothetical protein EH165_09930 [Nakamurella antarctica]